jgi:hypothetical protein
MIFFLAFLSALCKLFLSKSVSKGSKYTLSPLVVSFLPLNETTLGTVEHDVLNTNKNKNIKKSDFIIMVILIWFVFFFVKILAE